MKVLLAGIGLVAILLGGCVQADRPILPLVDRPETAPHRALIWQGYGQAYRMEGGQWVRAVNYDYEFTVVQRRFAGGWKSIKSLHRRHSQYDGWAGQRDQTMYFELDFKKSALAGNAFGVSSSLGSGQGLTDSQFRTMEIGIALEPATPIYNQFSVKQTYDYEGGRLTETVLLTNRVNGVETPFMKMEEQAQIFAETKLSGPPVIE